MRILLPSLLMFTACGSSSPLDQPNPAPTWYIEEPDEDPNPKGAEPAIEKDADSTPADATTQKSPSEPVKKKEQSSASKSDNEGVK